MQPTFNVYATWTIPVALMVSLSNHEGAGRKWTLTSVVPDLVSERRVSGTHAATETTSGAVQELDRGEQTAFAARRDQPGRSNEPAIGYTRLVPII
ncbi:hypothetical protein GGR00_002123 [Aminobacter aganoensis]|uniref:Uncharacterized protein n=1 Tax=Aminobacter aganoensis TaxID=83264 RepID=A0A7X0F781_9HYPH|nr:hypothetical protein [Aminobacter aganoensis]